MLYVDTINLNNTNTHNYISIKYIPELEWYLVVETFTGEFWEKLKKNILYSGAIIVSLLAILITFISYIISKSERRAKSALEERMRYFQDAARNMFGSIYEIDVSKNIFSPESKLHQFDLLKNMGEQSYTDSLQLLAQRLIKKEYREVFLDKFSCRNVLLEFGRGTDHIGMDCQILLGDVYQWLRFDGYIFFVERDKSVHMYLYSKNVNDEVTILAEARNDALTGCLTRGATQQAIEEALLIDKDKLGAFFIMDIDNFKRANDTFGHGFGDYCIQQFANGIRKAFRSNDIVGRIGGDEFVVYLSCPDKEWVRNKARQLVQILNMDCVQGTACLHISASIGVAFYPENGTDMATLYKNADAALYVVKERGKNNFEFYESAAVCSVGKGFTEEED